MTGQDKKKRIAELRAELRELEAAPRSDWHAAFEAFLRFTTHKYDGVTITPEAEIGISAPRTDYLILTGDGAQQFEESIFRIFRRINILEYKNPHDSLNDRVVHKICGYAYLMIGTSAHEGDVPKDQVTISIFRAVKNPVLFRRMERDGELEGTGVPGIYRVTGITKLPFQIVIMSELEGEGYAACRALTDRAKEADVRRVLHDLSGETDDAVRGYYGAFLDLLAEKNPSVFSTISEEEDMQYPSLWKVFEKDLNKHLEERVNECVAERLEERVDAEVKNSKAMDIRNLMANLKLTLEQAMDALSIPQAQRDTYAGLVREGR